MDILQANVRFDHVQPSGLRNVWPTVKHGMEITSRYSKGNWIPEEAFSAILAGTMSLYLAIVDKRYAGFIVLQKRTGFNGQSLHIFSLYVKNEYGKYIDANMEQIEEIAKSHNCNRITFQSPRRGWERRGARLGFEAETVIFGKDI